MVRHPSLIRTPVASRVLLVSLCSEHPLTTHTPSSFPKAEVGLLGHGSPLRAPPSVKSYDCPSLQRHLDFLLTVGVVLSETLLPEWLWGLSPAHPAPSGTPLGLSLSPHTPVPKAC